MPVRFLPLLLKLCPPRHTRVRSRWRRAVPASPSSRPQTLPSPPARSDTAVVRVHRRGACVFDLKPKTGGGCFRGGKWPAVRETPLGGLLGAPAHTPQPRGALGDGHREPPRAEKTPSARRDALPYASHRAQVGCFLFFWLLSGCCQRSFLSGTLFFSGCQAFSGKKMEDDFPHRPI